MAWLAGRHAHVRIVGVQPAGAASMAAALAAGAPVNLHKIDSFVDGAAVRRAGRRLGRSRDRTGDRPAAGETAVVVLSGGNNDVSRYAEVVERSPVHEGRKHYFLVDFPQEPDALRRFLADVLGPDDDITLFEYVKRSNRETGPALVGIELGSPADLGGLLTRMDAAPPTTTRVPHDSPLFRFLV